MITPGGIPWYALVLQEPVLLAAAVAVTLALVGLIAWLGAVVTGGAPSWRMHTLVLGPLAALVVGGAAHWIQTRVLAGVHTAGEWSFMPRDAALPSATFWFSDNPQATPRRSLSLMLVRTVEGGTGIRAKSPTILPAHDPAAWPERIASEVRTLYPEMAETDAAAHAATMSGWVSFLSSTPPPNLLPTQQRASQGAYNVVPTIEPVERLLPWKFHWVVTMAFGVLMMLTVTMYLRRRTARRSMPKPA